MAGKYDEYEKILYGSKSSQKSKLSKAQSTASNYKARLDYGGIDPDEALDNRNWLEKGLNLTPNQNAIFDLFEIINRPQQALFGGIENFQKGGSFLEGMKEGITGDKDTAFKDILMNTGAFTDTTYEDLVNQGEEAGLKTMLKSIDPVDLLGLGGDVLLDPMDIPLIPVSAASKGAKAVDTVSDIAKAADTASDVAKMTDTASNISKATKFISPTQWLGQTAKKGVKGVANIADTGIEKLLNKVDNLKGTVYALPDAEWANTLGKMGDGTSFLETYKGLKNNVKTMFSTKLSKGARDAQKLNDAKEYLLKLHLEENAKPLDDMVNTASKAFNISKAQAAKEINEIIDVVSDISLRDVISGAQNGTIKYSDEIVEGLKDLTKDLRPSDAQNLLQNISKSKDGMLQLSEDWEKLIDNFDVEKLQNKVKRTSLYSPEKLKEIEDLTRKYNETVPDVVQGFQKFYEDGNKLIEEQFGAFKGISDKYDAVNYSKHSLSNDYNDNIMKLATEYGVDPNYLKDFVAEGSGIGTRAGTLNTRKYQMSAGEANMLKKQQLLQLPGLSDKAKDFIKNDINLFDESAMAGVSKYIEDMPRYAKNTQMIDEVIMKQGFGDVKKMSELREALRTGKDIKGNVINRADKLKELNNLLDETPFRLLDNGKAPAGFKKIDQNTKDYLVRFLQSTGDKTGNKELNKMAQQLKYLDSMAVDPTVLNILKMNTDTARKNEFIKVYDGIMNYFKGNKTASFTNQMNNISGNTMNMMASGMGLKDYAKYTNQAVSDLHGFEYILRKGVSDISQLTPNERRIYENLELFSKYVTTPDAASIAKKYDIDGVIQKLDKKNVKLPLDSVRSAMASLNSAEDRVFRYATFLNAMENPKYLDGLGIVVEGTGKEALAKAAGQAVGKVLFDPSDLTSFEQNVMKRIVPFYTFTKKNLAFQIGNMGDNLQNYNKMMKAYNSLTNSYGEAYENMPDYLKDNMYIPIPVIGKDGKYKFVRAQLPFGDLTDLVSDPINSLVNRTSPMLKLPFELATGTNTFTGRPIESFPGQQGNIGILSDIPGLNTAKGQEILSNLTGLDTPIKQLDRSITAFREGTPTDILTNNLTISGNVDTDKLSRTYEQIEQLQNVMKQYQQQGYSFSTMTELKKANKNNTVAEIDAIFNKYGISTNNKKGTYSEYEDLLYNR